MWSIFFLLPNLSLREPVGNEHIAILPHDDLVIRRICCSSPLAKVLIEGFENQFKRKAYPSILVINIAAPDIVRDIEAIVGYRNAFALSTIIRAYEHRLVSRFAAFPLYSDYFDLYPITISRDDNAFMTSSPSVLGYRADDETNRFRGQTSPCLAGSDQFSASPDSSIFKLLESAWERRFVRRRLGEWPTRALFRSLEMAYQASSLPFKNHSIYDYGASNSLWVSAFEILSHPRSGKADLLSVLDLLGKYDWENNAIKRKAYKIRYRGTERRYNLVQRLYKDLYDTRNDFLHGNAVRSNRLHPFRNRSLPLITAFAPLIYKVALLSFLDQFKSKRRKKRMDRLLEYSGKLIAESLLAKAILKSKEQGRKG